MSKLVAFWNILTSGHQVGCVWTNLSFSRSEEDEYGKETEAIRSLQEQARHHLGYVGGLLGNKEHDGICYKSTDCKEG